MRDALFLVPGLSGKRPHSVLVKLPRDVGSFHESEEAVVTPQSSLCTPAQAWV